MTASINGTTGVTFPDASVQGTAATGFGFKNRIINGDMRIDQRNAGASVTPTTTNTYSLDRWNCRLTAASKYSVQQNAGSVTPPAGFTKYLGVTSLSSYSVGASDAFNINQRIEGFNVADLAWGTANASAVTLSFKVYSSLTGTFGGSVGNENGDRSYPFSYTVSSANTWTSVSVTVPGDTTGTWATTNGTGLQIYFNLGAGSSQSGTAGAWASAFYTSATGATSVVGTNGATLYITGVQLEKGSTATSFDYRPYGTELALCQRYYEKSYNRETAPGTASQYYVGSAVATSTTMLDYGGSIVYKVSKRSQPTLNFWLGTTANKWGIAGLPDGNIYAQWYLEGSSGFYLDGTSGATTTRMYPCYGGWTASAEL